MRPEDELRQYELLPPDGHIRALGYLGAASVWCCLCLGSALVQVDLPRPPSPRNSSAFQGPGGVPVSGDGAPSVRVRKVSQPS